MFTVWNYSNCDRTCDITASEVTSQPRRCEGGLKPVSCWCERSCCCWWAPTVSCCLSIVLEWHLAASPCCLSSHCSTTTNRDNEGRLMERGHRRWAHLHLLLLDFQFILRVKLGFACKAPHSVDFLLLCDTTTWTTPSNTLQDLVFYSEICSVFSGSPQKKKLKLCPGQHFLFRFSLDIFPCFTFACISFVLQVKHFASDAWSLYSDSLHCYTGLNLQHLNNNSCFIKETQRHFLHLIQPWTSLHHCSSVYTQRCFKKSFFCSCVWEKVDGNDVSIYWASAQHHSENSHCEGNNDSVGLWIITNESW